MRTLGNIIWLVLGGLFLALAFIIAGVILHILIITIPFGRQCFKMAELSVSPFGKIVDSDFGAHPIANTLWFIFIGLWSAIGMIITGVVYCISIIGIPFGLQIFKFAKLVAAPFGADVK